MTIINFNNIIKTLTYHAIARRNFLNNYLRSNLKNIWIFFQTLIMTQF